MHFYDLFATHCKMIDLIARCAPLTSTVRRVSDLHLRKAINHDENQAVGWLAVDRIDFKAHVRTQN